VTNAKLTSVSMSSRLVVCHRIWHRFRVDDWANRKLFPPSSDSRKFKPHSSQSSEILSQACSLAKHSKSFALIDFISVGVDRMQ
jgi:hypothetical protein